MLAGLLICPLIGRRCTHLEDLDAETDLVSGQRVVEIDLDLALLDTQDPAGHFIAVGQ